MANPPPPYDDLTGISRTVMKDNAQESVTNNTAGLQALYFDPATGEIVRYQP